MEKHRGSHLATKNECNIYWFAGAGALLPYTLRIPVQRYWLPMYGISLVLQMNKVAISCNCFVGFWGFCARHKLNTLHTWILEALWRKYAPTNSNWRQANIWTNVGVVLMGLGANLWNMKQNRHIAHKKITLKCNVHHGGQFVSISLICYIFSDI